MPAKRQEKPECGSRKAYLWHLRQRKLDPMHEIDDDCRNANNKTMKEYLDRNQAAREKQNFYTRTVSAAQTILAQRYAEEFAEILEQERKMELNLMRMTGGIPWERANSSS